MSAELGTLLLWRIVLGCCYAPAIFNCRVEYKEFLMRLLHDLRLFFLIHN